MPPVQVHYGFNGWEVGTREDHLKPTNLWRGENIDWWAVSAT